MKRLKAQIEEWDGFCARSYASTTCNVYRCIMRQMLQHLSENGNQLSAKAIEDFLDAKFKAGGSRKQFNLYRMVVSSFGSWRHRRYGIENPVDKIPKIKEGQSTPRVLTEQEYKTIVDFAKGLEKDIIRFLGNTGLRREEFRQLKWKNVDPALKFIRITGKGDKTRIVPLNSTCREILLKYKRLNDDKPLQIAAKYSGIQGASWLCKKLSRKTGVERFGVHAIRHYFATMLIRKGISIFKVSKILGHVSVLITQQVYIHLLPADLLGITDVLD